MKIELNKVLDKNKFAEKIDHMSKGIEDATANVTNKAKGKTENLSNPIVNTIDGNGNGRIDIEDVIIMGLNVPGIKINRADFLQKELCRNHPQAVIDKAIADCPAHTDMTATELNKTADNVIQYERTCVSGISAALGIPGGAAMAATIPADIAQYYGYMLRAAQKLLYLYGFPQIDVKEKNSQLDSGTINMFIVCLGTMYGVAEANNALKAMSKGLAAGVEKKLLNTALTKGTIYPVVKKVSRWFGVKMTKQVFAGFFKNAIPVVGGVLGGGITYFSFKPCCDNLKKALQNPEDSTRIEPGPSNTTPPPLQTSKYHVAVNGQATGPFDRATLVRMAASGNFSKNSLVWKQGMENWVPAEKMPDLQTLFGEVPPPVPTV